MKLNTSRFGEIELSEEDIFTFPHGLPGFEQERKYIILQPDTNIPFQYLQSVDDGDLAFIITTPFIFYPSYEFQLSDSIQNDLQIKEEQEAMVWSIVSITEHFNDATINLLAPIITNSKSKLGKQLILHDTEYQTKHKLITVREAE